MSKKEILFLIMAVGLLSGCRIDFEAQSNVRDDGSIERTTVYKGQESADKEEILARYEIPVGGQWTENTVSIPDPQDAAKTIETHLQVYTVKKIVNHRQQNHDFKRFSESHQQAAVNQFGVGLRDFFFVKWFTYEERFKDIIDRANMDKNVNQLMEHTLSAFRQQLMTGGIPDAVLLDRITEVLRNHYHPLLSKFVEELKKGNINSAILEPIANQLESDFTPEATFQLLVQTIPELDTPANKELVAKALNTAQLLAAAELEPLKETIFGIHGLALLQQYNFKISVRLPGKILTTNAPRQENGALIWEFDSNSLDQTMRAASRKVYPGRMLVAVLAAGLLIGGTLWRRS